MPALFESAPIGAVTAVSTVTPEATVAPGPAQRASAAAEVPAVAVPSPPAEVGTVPADREPAQVMVERERMPVPVPGPAERSPLPTPAARRSQPAAQLTPSTTPHATVLPATLPVQAIPIVPAAPLPAAAMNESSAPGQRGPDVIRVSIGRVDVRAPAPPPLPARPQVPVPAAKSDRLSLQDYLRGQRGTR